VNYLYGMTEMGYFYASHPARLDRDSNGIPVASRDMFALEREGCQSTMSVRWRR
jgi:hypothetical protein